MWILRKLITNQRKKINKKTKRKFKTTIKKKLGKIKLTKINLNQFNNKKKKPPKISLLEKVQFKKRKTNLENKQINLTKFIVLKKNLPYRKSKEEIVLNILLKSKKTKNQKEEANKE